MHLPGPLRAAVGLVATAADEARRLPDRAVELPMLAVSTALQASVRAQQRYARLTARGDAVLNRTRPTDEPPAWATFDDSLAEDELGDAPNRFDVVEPLPADDTVQTARLVGELIGAGEADEDAGEAEPGPNGALPNALIADPEERTHAPAARIQPRQPPPRKHAQAESAQTSTAQKSPDSEPADS